MAEYFRFSPINISLKRISYNRCNSGNQYRGNLDRNSEWMSIIPSSATQKLSNILGMGIFFGGLFTLVRWIWKRVGRPREYFSDRVCL